MTSIRVSSLLCMLGSLGLSCGLLLSFGGVSGCQNSPKPPEPQMAPPDRVAALRESIQKSQPGAQVGQVIATITTPGPYAAVADLPLQDVKVGQTITFVDIDGQPVSNGTVSAIVGDALHVKYDTAGKRPPQRGDLAIWFKG